MKRAIRKIVVHFIVQSFLHGNKRTKKTMVKAGIKLALRKLR